MPNDDEEKKQSKSFKKLEDILNIDSSTAFDDQDAERELRLIEERQAQVKAFKQELKSLNDLPTTDDYMNTVIKQMVGKGMSMLNALQLEIEGSPRGRDVETAASMISAINSLISNMNQIKVYNAKIGFEREKIDLKKQALEQSAGQPVMHGNNNILMVGSTNDLMELLMKKDIIGGNSRKEEAAQDVVIRTDPDEKDKKDL